MPGEISKEFKDTINRSKNNKEFDKYDADIMSAVAAFNRHLKDSEGYVDLNWLLIKSMVWVETGGPNLWSAKDKKYVSNSRWETQPMSMGSNPKDPGLEGLMLSKSRGTFELFVPSEYRVGLGDESKIKKDPVINIQAGIAYLLLRFAKLVEKSVVDVGSKDYEYTIKDGDSFWKIAKENRTTAENLQEMNRGVVLKKGNKVVYKKASRKLYSDPALAQPSIGACEYFCSKRKSNRSITCVTVLKTWNVSQYCVTVLKT